MFSDFYEKNIYKKFYKKTTPEEKKEVVNNIGEYFPENHSNKIKGMDELAEAVVNNAMKKQDEILSIRPAKAGYMWKKCAICGEAFESYRGIGKYCSEKCTKKANAKLKREHYKKKNVEEEKKGINSNYKYCAECGKTFMPTHKLQKYCCGKCAKDAENRRQREAYKKQSLAGETYYQRNKSNAAIGRANVAVEEAIKEVEEVKEFDYLGTLEIAIEIVRGVKAEEDVKIAVDKVFETLKHHLTK